jgi:hypothetical protein
MGRRRRRWREPGYVWWTGFGALGVAALLMMSWRLALLDLLAWCLYQVSLNPAVCRVVTRQGLACHEPVRGRVFACSPPHQQVKNEALWRAIGLSNPFRRTQIQDPNRDTGVVVYSPTVRARLQQNERVILTIVGLGTLAAFIGAVYGLTR